jgi:hypothetical protein
MRSARLSAAGRGSMLALALTLAALPGSRTAGQTRSGQLAHHGAILIQAVDTSINPLPAEIVLPAFGIGVRLSEEGVVLLLNIPDGTYLVQARHLGHRPEWRVVRIAGDTASAEFVLPPADLARGSHGHGVAESRLREFLRRSVQIQQASFITRAEIQRRRPKNLAALLGRLPEITVEAAGSGPTVVRSERVALPQCRSGMLIFVDGMLPTLAPVASAREESPVERRSPRGLRPERATFGAGAVSAESAQWPLSSARELAGAGSLVSSGPTSSRRNASPLEWLPISLVAGVEVYPTVADVPPEFLVAGAECGAVLVWTVRR